MKTYTFYHRQTGVFAELVYRSTNPEPEKNTPPEHEAVEGFYHPHAHRMDISTGKIVRADAPSAEHEWSEEVGRWVPGVVLKARIAAANNLMRRRRELADEERDLMRRAVLGMLDAAGRARLAAIDQEISCTIESSSQVQKE